MEWATLTMVDSILIVTEANGGTGRNLCRHFGRSSETYYENHWDRALPTTLIVDAAFEVGDSLWLNCHDRSVAWFSAVAARTESVARLGGNSLSFVVQERRQSCTQCAKLYYLAWFFSVSSK